MNKWYQKSGQDGDVAISSRIRLARNLKSFPFPSRLPIDKKEEIVKNVKVVINENKEFLDEEFKYSDPNRMHKEDVLSLVERRILSPEFLSGKKNMGAFVSKNENVSVLINEEDHIRLQVLKEGFALDECYKEADRIDDLLDKNLCFAFDDNLGYLTQCLTNLGTGMRASIMLHLPGLSTLGGIERVVTSLIKLGLTLRGTYGEGSKPLGDLYQLSNQVTLGLSESSAIKNLEDATKQLIEQERKARGQLLRSKKAQDSIHRAEGILKTALLLGAKEFMSLISKLRLLVWSAKDLDQAQKCEIYGKIGEITIKAQDGNIIKQIESAGYADATEISSQMIDQARADYVREKVRDFM